MSKMEPATPDFGKMEISSVSRRKTLDRTFLCICVVTSMTSIIVLGILLVAIFARALPVFGPHSDDFESTARYLIVQGSNEGNDPQNLDSKDLIQGVFNVNQFTQGGLGTSNDEIFGSEEGSQKRLIGFYSFEISDLIAPKLFDLQPASGDHNVMAIAEKMGLQIAPGLSEELKSQATVIVMETEKGESLDLAKLKAERPLGNEKLIEEISRLGEWKITMVIGLQESNFANLDLTTALSAGDEDATDLSKISKVGYKRQAGRLTSVGSILSHIWSDDTQFKPVKSWKAGTDSLVSGEIKIDSSDLIGLRRRRKNGFDLGGEVNLTFCPTPEQDASTSAHVSKFMTETNKSDPSQAGIGPALQGTLWVCVGCALFALPLGVGTAILLEEFKPTNRILLWLHSIMQINITNLAGVPSIVYGILGLTAFASMFGLMGSNKEPEFEFGATHYFQYLSEGNQPILVPTDLKKRRIGRQIEKMARTQKNIFNATSAIGNPLPVNQKKAIDRNEKFLKQLDNIKGSLEGESVNKLTETQASIQDVLNNLNSDAAENDQEDQLKKELAKKAETRLRDLAEEIQKPILTDGMNALSADKDPLVLNILADGDEYPTDDSVLAVTLRKEAVGGVFADKAWYYIQIPFGRSVLAASLTLMLVILPVIIIASQEALRAVPPSLRECALGLGSTPWQVVRNVTLPAAIPGIMTGAILSMSRAIGEAAPILIICGILFATSGPTNLMDPISILPIQIYNTTKLPVDQELLINTRNVAAAGIVVLLAILLTFNGIAVAIRQWTQRPLS